MLLGEVLREFPRGEFPRGMLLGAVKPGLGMRSFSPSSSGGLASVMERGGRDLKADLEDFLGEVEPDLETDPERERMRILGEDLVLLGGLAEGSTG